ncbi:MAG: SDR family oxidoreductase [Verrucomicrobiales bacterium]|nr:SDR family oxidoreductase [Verrucomicrobiales bacterium]
MEDSRKTYLIAGGNSGIGLATVHRLAAAPDPCRIICAVRRPGPLEFLRGVECLPFDATVAEPLSAAALPDRLDGLVYCPGTIELRPFSRLRDEDFQRDWEINFLGAVRLLRAALPALKKAGSGASVVLFSSVAAKIGLPFHASIAAAKGAVEALARSLAAELAPAIRVNVLAPSLTDTPLAAPLLSTPEKAEAARQRHPLRAIGDPNDLAAAVEFLLGAESVFLTGQVIAIDGGLSTLKPL